VEQSDSYISQHTTVLFIVFHKCTPFCDLITTSGFVQEKPMESDILMVGGSDAAVDGMKWTLL
jgi:hypothetical protein